MKRRALRCLVVGSFAILGLAGCSGEREPLPAPAVGVPLIPRRALFGNPEKQGGQISPDGRWLAYLAPDGGVLNLHLASRKKPDEVRMLTHERERGPEAFFFAHDGRHLLYTRDEAGDENYRLFAVDLQTGEKRPLTPPGAMATVEKLSARIPGEVLVSINDRDPSFFDLVRIDLATAASARLTENGEFSAFLADDDFRPRFASRQTPNGGKEWLLRQGESWVPWVLLPPEDAILSGLLHLSADGEKLYYLDSRGRNTAGLLVFDARTGEAQLLAEDSRTDVEVGLADPATGAIQATVARYLRSEWRALDPAVAADLAFLRRSAGDAELEILSRSQDDRLWVVGLESPRAGMRVYLYDRDARSLAFWYAEKPGLAELPLAAVQVAEISSRDHLLLPSYYLLPPGTPESEEGAPAAPLPLVLRVHGGPWNRDRFGSDAVDQWLANRGYAVLKVNFRGSTGFGKAFVNAGDGEWGRKMQDDLSDAVAWAIGRGLARPDRVAILGASYGGYAALSGLTSTPEQFACGISVVGPSNLETLLASVPPYWQATRRLFTARVGDPDTAAGRALLAERSPLHRVDRIRRPLLIAQGANDPRVKKQESEQIVKAMTERGLPVTYVLFPDEGHGFARPENELAFSAVVEEFLAGCLGGHKELTGGDFAGSSITVPVGAELLPGVAGALASLPRNGSGE
jgi:dipeptidyl aminopeptidase/acylaminoacyl peptidase